MFVLHEPFESKAACRALSASYRSHMAAARESEAADMQKRLGSWYRPVGRGSFSQLDLNRSGMLHYPHSIALICFWTQQRVRTVEKQQERLKKAKEEPGRQHSV